MSKAFPRRKKKSYAFRIATEPNTINVICEGDSWLNLPIRTNIPTELENLNDSYNFYRLDSSGDEVLDIISGNQKQKFREILSKYPTKTHYILFSGGGNDLVGQGFREILLEEPNFATEILENRLELIKSAYKELIYLRNIYAPNVKIVTHTYDYPVPQDKPIQIGPISIGPWMFPGFNTAGWTNKGTIQWFSKYLIDEFANVLFSLQKDYKDFTVVDLRGILEVEDWEDEIHPSEKGFKKIAKRISKQLHYY